MSAKAPSAWVRRRRRWRGQALAGLFRALAWAFKPLPWRAAQACGRQLGRWAWWVVPRDRRRVLEHLGRALPELSAPEHFRLARECFRHHGTTLGETLWLLTRNCDAVARVVDTVGFEQLAACQAAGRPALILTGHCGNWELLAAVLNCHGAGMSVVARALDDDLLQGLLVGLRARFGTTTIERSGPNAARELLKVLRGGKVLGMLIDQDTRVDGVWVPFLGQPAFTPVGAARIALSRGVVVLPTFIERLPNGRHRATMEPPLDLPADETAATALMTQRIESQIRRVPAQWVWMHRRWRRQEPRATPASPANG